MKRSISLLIVLVALFASSVVMAQKDKMLFPQKPGVVSYTYRTYFQNDARAALDTIKSKGITDIEFSNLFGKTAAELRKMCDDRGVYCSSFGVGYDDLVNKTAIVAQNAKTLGAQYVRIAGMPHKGTLTLEDAQKAIDAMNTAGKILKEQYNLGLIYHNHGFEFEPYADGTLYDLIVTKTDPRYVNFELDILWAFLPGEDPAALLTKYGSRYKTLHLKDLRKGVPGNHIGATDKNNDVELGSGQINIPAVLQAAEKAGVHHYYIEDESDNIIVQVPKSIAYLKTLKR